MISSTNALRDLFTKFEPTAATYALRCNPIKDKHGHTCAWVIIAEASPPRGTLFLSDRHIQMIGRRKLKDRELEIVRRFYREQLEGKEDVVVIE